MFLQDRVHRLKSGLTDLLEVPDDLVQPLDLQRMLPINVEGKSELRQEPLEKK